MHRRRNRAGFTLIELMIVITILSVLVALGIPAYQTYVRRAKAGEVSANFDALYKGAATLFENRNGHDRGTGGDMEMFCAPDFKPFRPDSNPGPMKRSLGYAPLLNQLGMNRDQDVYFSYGVLSEARCGIQANDMNVMTFIAIGDLDGDDLNSEFSLAIGTDDENRLYHSPTIYKQREFE